jgi:D-alanine-D-alanine ligase
MDRQTVAVLYGGKSTEHEVSIITALQVMHNLNKTKYDVLPIYIDKSGKWFLGNSRFLDPLIYKDLDAISGSFPQVDLTSKTIITFGDYSLRSSIGKIDVVIPAFHGTFGEDGSMQGLLEMANIPYMGCGVMASAVGMDKLIQKQLFSAEGLPQVKYNTTGKGLKFPLFVKPSNGGSSIGITKVKNAKELADAIEVSKIYDRRVIVEESAEGYKEINISVLGNTGIDLETSVCEQPVPSDNELLTFQDKYESSNKSAGMASAKRLIPAPISQTTSEKIAQMAKIAFEAIDGAGFARIDFLVSPDEKKIFINEINTLPGSFAFYLWEASGLKFPQLLDRLIELALQRHKDRSERTLTFSSNILESVGDTLKGGKLKI